MYATYFYNAGSTAANILADVVAMLTGTTDVNSLSASCDKVNSVIYTGATAAGWTLHDASAGTNAQCLKAAVADSASQYKFLVIDTNTAGYILLKLYEAWNETTHAGTNLAYNSNSTSYCQRLNVTSGGRLDISASVRHCFMFSYQSSTYGATTGSFPSGVLERTRRSPWDTVANGYLPAAFVVGASQYNYECKRVNRAAADVTGTSAVAYCHHAFGALAAGAPPANSTSTVPIDGSKTLGHMLVPFGIVHVNDGHLGGDFSSLCDIFLTTYNNGSSYDTLTYNGNTYVIWAAAETFRFAVRRG